MFSSFWRTTKVVDAALGLAAHFGFEVAPFYRTAHEAGAALSSGGAFRVQAAARVPKYAEPS
ncbi:hypothetical protein C1881_03455 [Slackia isoflavoniconvertens]|uniref:Uncharacterized protein n=1 Tax=Slackia isoflavoniconvertens TaxID=572010 RepID=A0A369LKU8_9ACTN|nr:hypothetical protein C1881_03455 [Slackia isoflavoniconvertens]